MLENKLRRLKKSRKTFFTLPTRRKRKKFAASRWSYSKKRLKKQKKISIKILKEKVMTIKRITKPRFGTLFIKKMRRNTFLNISRRLKNNALDKYGKKSNKAYWCIHHAVSIGHLRIYKGRAKSSSIALRALANV